MLNNFNLIKSCFGSDDDEDEKFEIKKKKERKVSYNPNANFFTHKKKKKKGSEATGYKSEGNTFITTSNDSTDPHLLHQKQLSIDVSKFKLEKRKYSLEYDYGNIEYKLKLCDVDANRIEELTTQMNFRLDEGHGECYYEIGVEDNGNPLGISKEELEISVNIIAMIGSKLNSQTKIVRLIQGKTGLIAELYIKKQEEVLRDKLEIKIGLLGEECSGKSTLIGVLVSNMLDNGKGLARTNVFRHKHEILCGKTSSISHQILGFDEKGELTNYGDLEKPSWAQIVHKSSKIINFYDMGGSAKNFKKTSTTTLSPDYLDYLLLVIPANEGITKRTEDFLNFAYNMHIPIITIITKTDLIDEEKKKQIIQSFKSTITKLKIGFVPLVMKTNDDVVLFSRNIQEKNLMLIFFVSNMQWEGLNLFKTFLSMLPVNNKLEDELKAIEMEEMEFDIHETNQFDNRLILVGIVSKGKIKRHSKCFLGPDSEGNFSVVEIVDIHCKKIDVAYTYKGQYCSICIKSENGLGKDKAKKGMVLLDIRSHPIASTLFEVEVWTIDGTRRAIKSTYQPILNIKHIRQCVKIKHHDDVFLYMSENNNKENDIEILLANNEVNYSNVSYCIEEIKNKKALTKKAIDKKKSFTANEAVTSDELVISSTEKTKLILEFKFNPEYITVGSNVIINDQLLKAFGVVTRIFK